MHEKANHLPTQILKHKQKSNTDNNKILLSQWSSLLHILFNVFLCFRILSVYVSQFLSNNIWLNVINFCSFYHFLLNPRQIYELSWAFKIYSKSFIYFFWLTQLTSNAAIVSKISRSFLKTNPTFISFHNFSHHKATLFYIHIKK